MTNVDNGKSINHFREIDGETIDHSSVQLANYRLYPDVSGSLFFLLSMFLCTADCFAQCDIWDMAQLWTTAVDVNAIAVKVERLAFMPLPIHLPMRSCPSLGACR